MSLISIILFGIFIWLSWKLYTEPNPKQHVDESTEKQRDADEQESADTAIPQPDLPDIQMEPITTREDGEKKGLQKIVIYYASMTRTTEKYANRLQKFLAESDEVPSGLEISVCCMSAFPLDRLMNGTRPQKQQQEQKNQEDSNLSTPLNYLDVNTLHVFIPATYEHGTPTPTSQKFHDCLQDLRFDHRVAPDHLSELPFIVVGSGSSVYRAAGHYCTIARQWARWLSRLGAKRVLPLVLLDTCQDMEKRWAAVERAIQSLVQDKTPELSGLYESDEEDQEEELDENGGISDSENQEPANGGNDQLDLEDVGVRVAKPLLSLRKERKIEIELEGSEIVKRGDATDAKPKKPMLNPMLEQSLTKQGYKLVGSHSAVKLCRWTKSMLRGRGGCYKHAFYGIASHQCMEATPSLACANKCVFCWRHHSNPVGTEWRWQMDEPRMILDEALFKHRSMIKQMRGVPGVTEERVEEGMKPRHCALSLVGEPIMYPRINEFLKMLHGEGMSSFLVTNAQFPAEIRNLGVCTQLYVSVDAATKESLKAVDRPLFSDFWERFLDCMDALATKKQRTVYRLTLVKDYNTVQIQEYANLIQRGRPDFVEIKGVTYCGFSGASPLTMKNVPYQEEVVMFAEELVHLLQQMNQSDNVEYTIACEHAHSCSILLANKTKFYKNNRWHTWIDYDRFLHLVHEQHRRQVEFLGEEKNNNKDQEVPILSNEQCQLVIDSVDYMAETPAWAVYGSEERGFNPNETRHYRKKKSTEAADTLE